MSRPKFELAWAAARKIYDPDNSSAKVAKVIGGKVAYNLTAVPIDKRWTNTCAVRMSYILNYSGLKIPPVRGQTVSGADHRQYFFRVSDLIKFLTEKWGHPDLIAPHPQPDNGALRGKRGIILFEVSGWHDAKGHATLWDGTICYDHCYFYEPNIAYTTDRANFWSLS